MTAPYTQQNYADWKARFRKTSAVGGLLSQGKSVAGMEEEPEQPVPPMLQQAPPELPPVDPHQHQKGLRGGILHALGADRTAPEVDTLLGNDPSKIARTKPGILSTLYNAVVEGKGPQTVQRERARTMLDLGDEKKARTTAARQESEFLRIKQTAEQMPVGPERSEYYARAVAEVLNNPVNAMQTAVGLREREFAPQRVTWTTVPMMVDGAQKMVMRSNDGQLLDASSGADLREAGAQMEPIPIADTFTQMAGETPTGNIPLVGNRSGQVRDSGIVRPDVSDRTQAAVRREVSSNRAQMGVIDEALAELKAYPDAVGLARVVGDAANQRVDPKGVKARAALANIGSLRVHDRSGAAVTAKEFPRLRPFIPSVTDTYETAKTKLESLRRELERETEELDKGMAPASAATELRKTSRPKPTNASDAEWAAFLMTKGERP